MVVSCAHRSNCVIETIIKFIFSISVIRRLLKNFQKMFFMHLKI